jgi:hypothetical protein
MNFQVGGGLPEVARQYGFEVRTSPHVIWVNFYVLGARASKKFSDYKGDGQAAFEMYVERWIRDYGPKLQQFNRENARAGS